MTPRVLLADDHADFRRAARTVVQAAGFEVVGEATSGEEALELVERLRPNLVLMDIRMPGMGGIAATRMLAARRPQTTTILLSTYAVEDLPPQTLTCGAAGYVPKAEFGPRALRRAYCSAR